MPIKPTHSLNQSPLYKTRSRSKLAKLLRVTNSELLALSKRDDLYSEFDIVKNGGSGSRHVENPTRILKLVQAKLARILGQVNPPDFLFCPVKRRCYVTNAAVHRNNRVIQCLDIQKFFPSTPQRRVYWFFHKIMKCERDIAGLLARLACYQGHLPTGSPLSPIMAYFAYFDLWQKIAKFCSDRGYAFTVYIDDVTISGNRVPRGDIWEVKKWIHGAGLHYHKEKTYIDQPAEVTGTILNRGTIQAPFRQHKKMHEAKSNLANVSDEERASLMGRIAGIEGQIRQISSKN